MWILRYRPSAPLSNYVECLWWSRRDLPQLHGEHMLPSASAQLIWALHDAPYSWKKASADKAATVWSQGVVHGPQWTYFVSGPKPCGAVAGVSFRAGAASAVLGFPVADLTDRHVSLDALWGACGRSLRGGFARLASIQRQTGYSPKHFIGLFRGAVGLTPKHYYRVKRFMAVLQAQAAAPRPSLAELAASSGYADQSHLTREFREFAGITPTQYRPRGSDSLLHHAANESPRPSCG